jgi:hypothetical protein
MRDSASPHQPDGPRTNALPPRAGVGFKPVHAREALEGDA